jgi:Tripartite tricarboxylate transporter TctB family
MIKSQKDFFSGLMFTLVGGAFAWGAWSQYTVGTGARMGPGYFPLLLGAILVILGALITFYSLVERTADGDPVGAFAWRPLILILGANLAFGVLLGGLPSIGLPPMGLIAAIFALTIISSKAGSSFVWREVILLAIVLSAGSYVTFIWMLNLQMPVWPAFIAG